MPNILYSCKYCNRNFKTEEEAIKCEKSHFIPIGIKECHYCQGYNAPSLIEIAFEDGHVRYYRYE